MLINCDFAYCHSRSLLAGIRSGFRLSLRLAGMTAVGFILMGIMILAGPERMVQAADGIGDRLDNMEKQLASIQEGINKLVEGQKSLSQEHTQIRQWVYNNR